MKKLIIPFFLLLTAACSKEPPAPVQAVPAPAVKQEPTPNTVPTCTADYAQHLRTCTPYTCRHLVSAGKNKVLIRVISTAENGLCQETVSVEQPAPEQTPSASAGQTPAQDSSQTNPLKQNCLFNDQQRNQMADYLAFYFNSLTLGNVPPATTQQEPAPINPLEGFLQDGTCIRPEKYRQGITCTGTENITVIFTEEDGTETRQTIACEVPPAPQAQPPLEK